jgi:hypothetical protein
LIGDENAPNADEEPAVLAVLLAEPAPTVTATELVEIKLDVPVNSPPELPPAPPAPCTGLLTQEPLLPPPLTIKYSTESGLTEPGQVLVYMACRSSQGFQTPCASPGVGV